MAAPPDPTLELAHVEALHHVPARARAALLLRDVAGLSEDEVADALGAPREAVHASATAARAAVDRRLPSRPQAAWLGELGAARCGALLTRYAFARRSTDPAALHPLLTEDVVWRAPPATRHQGRAAVAAVLAAAARGDLSRYRPTTASGQLAMGVLTWDGEADAFVAETLEVLDVRAARISRISAHPAAHRFPAFGLPPRVAR